MFLAKLNNMKVRAADIGNAYLEAATREKLYIVTGPTRTHISDSQSTVWIDMLRFKMVTVNP